MKDHLFRLIDRLEAGENLSASEFVELIEQRDRETEQYLYKKSSAMRERYYGNKVYIRGLIEFTNYCKNDCLYCGIRKGNRHAERYRLTEEEILASCQRGYELGFRTFVLQGGEDPWFTDERILGLIREIKSRYSDCALTLSIGEKEFNSYQNYFDAGADRFLLRHETIYPEHYKMLHPQSMSFEHRQECLRNLKKIGFQTGCGFMVGAPGQTTKQLADELLFLKSFQPAMVGIGPFIPHCDTPFRDKTPGSADLTVF